jgi:hypothetical protein
MDTYAKWTDEEWTAVSKRAVALKNAKPDMSWTQVVPVCQDDIAPERRRFTINKVSSLKPMFDILNLDEHGNVKPPPPPPQPEPEPEPEPEIATSTATATAANPPFSTSLKDVPIDLLISEIFTRGTTLKQDMEALTKLEASIKATQAEQATALDLTLRRVNEAEEYTMQCMDNMDKIDRYYTETREMCKKLLEVIKTSGLKMASSAPSQDVVSAEVAAKIAKTPRLAPVRFLIVGVLEKELPRIKARLPRHLSHVDLLHGENSDSIVLPNVHYALVSGHNDCSRRWATIHTHYNDKAHRMANGSIGSFVHAIEDLCARRG